MTNVEQADNLATRAAWEPVMDMAAAHSGLKEAGGFINDLVKRPGATTTWRYMARIARAFRGEPDWNDRASAANYVRRSLGRSSGDTFLTELDPFPAKRAKRPDGLQDFDDNAFIRDVLNARIATQLDLLRQHSPRAVVCYGAGRRDEFAKRLGIDWQNLKTIEWRSAKSGKLHQTKLAWGKVQNSPLVSTTAFLLPFLGQGALGAPVLRAFVESSEFRACRG